MHVPLHALEAWSAPRLARSAHTAVRVSLGFVLGSGAALLTACGDSTGPVDHIVVHPDWFTRQPCPGNSKQLCLAPPAEDIGLVFLDASVGGITPAPIAGPTYLAGLSLTRETFTVVGYGVDAFITGSLFANHPIVFVDGIRSYRDVSVITTDDLFPDRFLKVTQSTCFGDSGGPLFHGATLVGINTWTFSVRCSGPNFAYRVDSPAARSFLAANL